MLDPQVRGELRGLPKGLADRVALHLVSAGLLLDDDPELAYQHAALARRLAARLPSVREAAGLAAYAVGKFAEAATDLKAARRMADLPSLLPVVADCERGLGRPERALALAASPEALRLALPDRIELLIVAAGARRDLGQLDAAVLTLRIPELDYATVADWTVRLRYAYADALEAVGRLSEAAQWFDAAADVDESEETDAARRAYAVRETRG